MTYARGVVCLLVAGVFLSTTGIFVRLIDNAGPWQVLFYRSLSFSIMVMLFISVTSKEPLWRRYRRFGRADVMVSLSLGVGFVFYLFSVFHTTVANTVLLLSTGPLLAAGLGWVVLRERVGPLTLFAMLLACFGVFVMFRGDLSGGHLTGMLFAMASVCSFAVMVVALRSGDPQQDRLPATAVAGIVAAVLCIPFIESLSISWWDLLMAICLGTVQVGVGFILVTLGARAVPSAQVPLLVLTETALAPLWVWWLVNEVPAFTTLVGGAIVIFAVLTQGIVGLRGERVLT